MPPKIFYFLFCAGILIGCSSPQTGRGILDTGGPLDSNGLPVAVTQEVLPSKRAETFDKFLKGGLSLTDEVLLKQGCAAEPNVNPFCYSVLNFELLEQKRKAYGKRPSVPRQPTIRPKFSSKQVQNWKDLRMGNINSLLRGISSARPTELAQLEELALAETACPNNIAIAVAASLEDDLPDRAEALKIAQLYAKGAECMLGEPVDKEILLTRAGLFFYVAKQPKKAVEMWAKSSQSKEGYTGRALYWLYRVQKELNENDGAKKALESLKGKYPFSFHTLIALSALGKDPGDILSKSIEAGSKKRSEQMPVVNRLLEQVEILRRLNYPESAARVLDWSIAESMEAEPEVRIYLAELKKDQGDHLSRLMILSDVLYKNPSLISKQTMDLYFPKVFFPVFEKNSAGIDPYFLLSVARQESAFNPAAVSGANARGLLQVQPATGKRFWGNKKPNLMDPAINVEVGARYLTTLLERTNGQVHLALSAYNAGEKRLATWLQRYPSDEPMLFIDLIPYRETREYIASILRNYFWYRRINREAPGVDPSKMFNLEVTTRQEPPATQTQ